MSVEEISPELRRALKRLCLGKMLDALPERLALAKQEKLPFEDILLMGSSGFSVASEWQGCAV